MPLCRVEAVILKMYNWSESSRTIVFFTREKGRLALIDKGGRSITSKRGRLLMFSRLELTYYGSEKSSDGYISDCELLAAHDFHRDGTLGRLAYASAACELCFALLPEHEPFEELYDYLLHFIGTIDQAERTSLPTLFLAFLLRFMSLQGYHPSLAWCAGCDRSIELLASEAVDWSFGPERGGIVCAACQRVGEQYIPLSIEANQCLRALQRASLADAAGLQIGFETAGTLLHPLTSFLQHHAGAGARLRSLDFLDKLAASAYR